MEGGIVSLINSNNTFCFLLVALGILSKDEKMIIIGCDATDN